jgi:hypothetical protein
MELPVKDYGLLTLDPFFAGREKSLQNRVMTNDAMR